MVGELRMAHPIIEIVGNVKEDMKPVFTGKNGLFSDPLRHFTVMYLLGLSGWVFGTILIGAVAKIIDEKPR
jgi:hypothetical protein